MPEIRDRDAVLAVLHDPAFVVPPVPPAASGVAWLRASVGRFSEGEAHARRRRLSAGVLAGIAVDRLRVPHRDHPVAVLGRELGLPDGVVGPVRDVAQAYQPGTGDEARADAGVDRLVALLGGRHDEPTAALAGVLVQACEPTAALVERARHRDVHDVLRDDPPVPATRRQALVAGTVGGVAVAAGEVVRVALAGDLAFGAGPRRCPGRDHALALVEGALA